MKSLDASEAILESGLCTARYAATLETALGLKTIGDLLHHFPRRYEDRSSFKPISEIVTGEMVTVGGEITAVDTITTRSRMTITKIAISDGSSAVSLVFFNQWYLKKQFDKHIGREMVAYGKANRSGGRLELSEVEWELVGQSDDDEIASDNRALSINTGRIVPIYPLSEGVKQQRLRQFIFDAMSLTADQADILPSSISRKRNLIGHDIALRSVHFPDTFEALSNAKLRLAYEGLFTLQLAFAISRRNSKAQTGIIFNCGRDSLAELKSQLEFSLTGAQDRAIAQIHADMQSPSQMNRLLQGDVGSGKTVVAMAALLNGVRSGYQAAIMAPTEILAEQHFRSISRVMDSLGVSVILVTGSSHRPKAKAEALEQIAAGTFSIVIGTHSLIQEGITFHRLGLAVIDEQHRFGVEQRATLRRKGLESAGFAPDVLVMTATPIPRTLTLTIYGDLDVSVIDELPPGRKPIKTHWKYSDKRQAVYESVRKLVAEGRQAYVICALVSESEKLQAKAATVLADHLSNDVFPEYKVGLLHGQMKADEKELAMAAFRSGETNILVSTTVIEVGVDVPNASIMVIEDADRFGLAQLHQLRGRVGRGSAQSYCILVSDPKSNGVSERLAVMEQTCDGFEIAEADLQMRGPGEFFGTRQSGVDVVPFAEVCTAELILAAREDASELLELDPKLENRDHFAIKEIVARNISRGLELKASN